MLNFNNVLNTHKAISGNEVNIDLNYDDNILNVISDIFEDMQNTKSKYDKKYLKLCDQLSKELTKRFGIPMKISHAYDVFACMPIDRYDSILINDLEDNKPDSKDLVKKIEKFKKTKIEIDLTKAYIYGLDGVYNTDLYLDYNLITNGELTLKELVAIQIHEIGHAFTYIYHSNKIIKNNITLLESFLYTKSGMTDKSKKILINSGINKSNDTTIIIKDITKENIKHLKEIENIVLGSNTNTRDSENEADAFAVRFGVGEDLTTALNKILSINNSMKQILLLSLILNMTAFLRLILTIGSINLTSILMAGVGVLTLFSAFVFFGIFINIAVQLIVEITPSLSNYFPYPRLKDRIKQMKIELIKILRSNKIDKKTKIRLLNNIDSISKTIETLNTNKYGNALLSGTNSFNYGTDIDIELIYTNMQNELQNNELHYLSEKINPGNEAEIVEDYKYYTTLELWSDSYIVKVLKENKNNIDKLNNVLRKYNINIVFDPENENNLILQSDKLYKFKDGITTIALIPYNKKENVITISTDWFKTIFHIENKYIKVDDVHKIYTRNDFCIYVVYEKQYDFNKNTKKDKNISVLINYTHTLLTDYGELPISEELDYLINYINKENIKLPKEVMEQLLLLKDLVIKYDLKGMSGFDLHTGNFAYDGNKIILMDTIFSRKAVALKLSNDVTIPDIK